MGDPLGDVESESVLVVELEAEVLSVRRRAWPQVENDVVDRPSDAPNHLRFLERRGLVVHAANRSSSVIVRDARLNDLGIEPVGGHLVSTRDACEEAALVLMPLGLEHDDSRDGEGLEFHVPQSGDSKNAEVSPTLA